MKLSCFASDLKQAVALAGHAAATKAYGAPILTHILLEADPDGGLAVTGTDLRIRARRRVEARIDQSGATTVSPKALGEFLALCPDGDQVAVSLLESRKGKGADEVISHRLHLVCGRAEVKLPAIRAEDFPPPPEMAEIGARLTLPASLFRLLVASTAFAALADPNDNRELLKGVLVRVRSGTVALAGADGFRLAVRRAAVEAADVDLDIIVPVQALADIAKVVPEDGTPVSLAVSASANAVLIEGGQTSWTVTLIEGQFPDFDRIIPREWKTRVTCDASRLKQSARLVLLTDDPMARLAIDEGRIEVRGRDASALTEADDMVDAAIDGPPIKLAVNARYLRDALAALGTDRASLAITGAMSPIVVRPADGDGSHTHVVMPMHDAKNGAVTA